MKPTGGKRTALFPGAFRPPHAAHLVGLESVTKRHDIDETVIVVSNVLRPFADGRVLDAEHVRAIWEIYVGEIDHVQIALAPHSAVGWVAQRIAEAADGEAFLLCAGERDLGAGDDRFGRMSSEWRQRGRSIEIGFLPTGSHLVRAADMRSAFECGDRDRFFKGLPERLSSDQGQRVWDLCEHGLREPSRVLGQKFEQQLASRNCRVRSFGRWTPPGNYWRADARLVDGRSVSIKHAGDGPKAAAPGEPRSAKPRKRLLAEHAAMRILSRCPTRLALPREVGFDERSWTLIAEDPLAAQSSLRRARASLGRSIAAQCFEASRQLGELHAATRESAAIRSSTQKDHEHALAWLGSQLAALGDSDPLWRQVGPALRDASQQASRRGFVFLGPDLDESRVAESGRIAWRNFEVAASCGDSAFDLGTLMGRLVADAISSGEEPLNTASFRRAALAHPEAREGGVPWMRRTFGFAAAALAQSERETLRNCGHNTARGLASDLLSGAGLLNSHLALCAP